MLNIILVILFIVIYISYKIKKKEKFNDIVLKGPSHFLYTDVIINKISDNKKIVDFDFIFKFNNNFAYSIYKSNSQLNSNKKDVVMTFKIDENDINYWKQLRIKSDDLEKEHVIKNISNKIGNKYFSVITFLLEDSDNPNITVQYNIDFSNDKLFSKNFKFNINQKKQELILKDLLKDQKIKKNNNLYKFDDLSETIPSLENSLLLNLAESECSEYTLSEDKLKKYYIDKSNKLTSGCVDDIDTVLQERRTKCNKGEKMIYEGDKYSDIKCAICSCPDNYIGKNPTCSGTIDDLEKTNYKGITGCEKNIKCQKTTVDKKGLEDCKDKECIYFDKPSEYGDKTKKNICKECRKKCPTGSYKIQDCNSGTNSDLICKPHRVCDVDTMITIRDGTDTKDTICQCIDGYKWPIDKITKVENRNADKCIRQKGKCHTNPCNKNAKCYDNFDAYSNFINFVCKCDRKNGYIETEKLGVGDNGCLYLPDIHPHITDINDLTDEAKKILSSDNIIDPKRFSIKKHLDTEFHQNINDSHIHKSINEIIPSPS